MNDFKQYLKINVDSDKTIVMYVSFVTRFFKQYPDFNEENINSYLTSFIDDNKSSSSFNLCLASLKKYAIFKEIEIKFPKPKKTTSKHKITLTRNDIENNILPYFDYMFQDSEKRKLIFRFMMLSLLRVSEVANLNKEDFDFKTNRINIIYGKGKKNRTTFIHKSLIDDLQKEFTKSSNDSAFNISSAYVKYMCSKINEMLGYKKRITPHLLRHAGAKFLYSNNVPLTTIKDMLGHASLQTTQIYLNYTVDEMQENYNKVKYKKGIKK